MKGKCRERDKQNIKFSKEGGNMLAPNRYVYLREVWIFVLYLPFYWVAGKIKYVN